MRVRPETEQAAQVEPGDAVVQPQVIELRFRGTAAAGSPRPPARGTDRRTVPHMLVRLGVVGFAR